MLLSKTLNVPSGRASTTLSLQVLGLLQGQCWVNTASHSDPNSLTGEGGERGTVGLSALRP